MTFVYQRIHYSVSNQRDWTQHLMRKTSQRTKVNTEALYMLSPWSFIVLTIHRIQSISPVLIVGGLIVGRIFEFVYRWANIRGVYSEDIFRGAYIRDFTVSYTHFRQCYVISCRVISCHASSHIICHIAYHVISRNEVSYCVISMPYQTPCHMSCFLHTIFNEKERLYLNYIWLYLRFTLFFIRNMSIRKMRLKLGKS